DRRVAEMQHLSGLFADDTLYPLKDAIPSAAVRNHFLIEGESPVSILLVDRLQYFILCFDAHQFTGLKVQRTGGGVGQRTLFVRIRTASQQSLDAVVAPDEKAISADFDQFAKCGKEGAMNQLV